MKIFHNPESKETPLHHCKHSIAYLVNEPYGIIFIFYIKLWNLKEFSNLENSKKKKKKGIKTFKRMVIIILTL